MEFYRCERCQAVLAEVATGPGDATGLLFDPVVERRIASAAARHLMVCHTSDKTQHAEGGDGEDGIRFDVTNATR